MSLGLKFLFLISKISSILVRLLGKGACIKKMLAVRNYSTNTIMEKNKQRGKGGNVKDMEFSGVK